LSSDAKHAETEKLGNALMQAVGRVVPALPVSLVATAMLQAGDAPLSLLDIKQRTSDLIGELERRGSYVHIPRADRDYAISVGLRMLTLRHLVLEEDGNYRANPNELMLLKYYANAIAHLFDAAVEQAAPTMGK
jgi:glycerol-3-phosphate O-acyltransferase